MFLFGMNLMSEHFKKIAGSKTQMILYKMTDKPIKSVFIGAGVTALIQSSSAVSAMAVSLIEGNIIKLRQAIAIILGTILGTSITGWIVAYSSVEVANPLLKIFTPSYLSAVFAIIGIILKLFMKKQQIKRFGEILLGFSVLMSGISLITQAVAPIKENQAFMETVLKLQNPFLLFFIGIFLSALLQSASASVGIVQTFSVTGIIGLNTTVSLLAGIGIGASLPVALASVGKNTEAKKAALSYFLINTIGALSVGVIFQIIALFIPKMILSPVSVAALNTIYRFFMIMLTMPFIGALERLCNKVIKKPAAFKKQVRAENNATT